MKRLFKKCKANALKMSKIFLVLVIFATEVLSPMVVMVNAKELPKMEKGDVYNPLTNTASDSASVTIGQLINEGDVSVVKTVKKTDVLGRYEVSFEVKGKNTVTNTTVTKPLYVVIVLDRSGSMVCDKTKDGYSYVVNKNAHYVAADGVGIACLDSYGKRNPSALIKDKWESAIDGAIEFSDSLVEKANTYVSLVTFSGTATEATDFRSNSDVVENQSIFAKSEFGHPQGSTNLKDAIAKAYKKLNTITTTDAQKYIVVIGDGVPTEGGNDSCNHTCSAKKQSTIAKNKGINIYSIGYGVDKNATAQEVLKYISSNTLVTSQNPTGYEIGTYTDNGYYLEATTSGIVNSFKTIFDNINVSLAGTNASLKDNLGGKFTFTISDSNVTDNGRSYTYNIGDIKEEGTKFSFFIDIDQDSPTGLYDTNDGFTLSYTDANGISKELPCGTNPQVYWEQNTYPYEIRYYKDEITNVNDATTYLGNVKGQAAHNANINVSLTKYIPEGYVSLVTNPTSLTVDKTKENIVNVLYVKRSDLSYTVRYYKDSVSDINLIDEVNVDGQTFNSTVSEADININKAQPVGYKDGVILTNMPLTIGLENNVINVLYTKNSYKYVVKYFYENVTYSNDSDRFTEDESLRSSNNVALFGDKITQYTPQLKDGFTFYKVDPTELVISEVEEDNVINVYYVRNNYQFVIKHLYQNIDGGYNVNDEYTVNGTAKYNEVINSSAYDKHELDGYIFNKVEPESLTISGDNSANEINFYYNLRSDLSYTVRYYKDSVSVINLIDEVNVDGQTFNSTVSEADININKAQPVGYKDGVILTNMPLTIGLENNVINVLYTKNSYKYVVKYFYENVTYSNDSDRFTEDESLRSSNNVALFGDKITQYTPQLKDGFTFYKVDPTELVISEVEEDNVINVYYVRNNYQFVIKHLYQNIDGGYNVNDEYTVNGTAKYNEVINSSAYDKHELDGYIFNKVEPESLTISGDNSANEINFYYNLRSDLSYTVRYYKDSVSDINLIDEVNVNGQTFGTVVSLDTVDRNLNKPYGYLDGVILNSGALVIGLSGNYIDVLYTKDDGRIVEEELFKTGDRVLNNVLNGVNYTIGYDAYIEDYVGEVTLTIVDELPYAIDVNKSNIGNGIYNSENNTITYVVNKTISENDRTISFEQNILVFYSEILESSINNKVISTLVYGDNTTNCEDEFVTEVLNGEVIVKYVDSENNELAESVKMTDLVGNDYITKAIAIEGYHLVETPDSATGKYVDGTIIVTYVYDEDGMGTDNPPHTGVSNEQYPYMSIIVLGALVLIKKFIK